MRQLSDVYRQFATVCANDGIRRAVVTAATDRPSACLRDAFTALVLARLPGAT